MGQEGATAQRASTPDDGWRRGRASDPAKAGGGRKIMVAAAPPLLGASVHNSSRQNTLYRVVYNSVHLLYDSVHYFYNRV